ncbi:hypothetical protein [Exiguobacterium sp. s133]|uniref:hypothetical protein n=1 Tax=Exiguobacterium sp. s133 TaxID=2751213 RepID=UPI001BEB764F|nr:hypothetical protein [Exiguobacterium sp. s133]
MKTLAKIYVASALKQAQKGEIKVTFKQDELDYLSDEQVNKLNNTYKLSGVDNTNMPEELISETLNQLKNEIQQELSSSNDVEAAYAGFYELGALESDETHLWKKGEDKEWN